MKHIISSLAVLICIIAGGFSANILRSSSESNEKQHEEAKEKHASSTNDGHSGEQQSKEKDKNAKKSHDKKANKSHGASGGGHGNSTTKSDVGYYKFSREFVVPIVRDTKVQSLIIMNINLEIDADLSQELFSMEPKLRDNIMTTLIEVSNDRATFENITNVESYEYIRTSIITNLKNVVPDGLLNVLILDIARQDV